MATITGYTSQRMKEMEDSIVIEGDVVENNLILTRYDGTQINAGNVRGTQGIQGPPGPVSPVEEALVDGNTYARKNGLWVPVAAGIQVVTSTTRPASPVEGTMIYETDTDRVYIWDGTVWVLPSNIPKLNQHFMAHRTTNLAVSSGVVTTIPMPTTIEATLGSGVWNGATGVLTIGTAGLYSVGWGVLWGSNSTGIRNGHIVDGVGNLIAMLEVSATSAGLSVLSGQAIRRFASGTTLSVRGYQSSGGSLNVEFNAQRTYFTVTPLF